MSGGFWNSFLCLLIFFCMLHIYHAAYMTSLQQCLLVMPLSEAFGTMLNTTSAAASTAQWRAQFKSCVCTHGILSENSLTTNLHTDIHNNTNITCLMANDQDNPRKAGSRTQRCVTNCWEDNAPMSWAAHAAVMPNCDSTNFGANTMKPLTSKPNEIYPWSI